MRDASYPLDHTGPRSFLVSWNFQLSRATRTSTLTYRPILERRYAGDWHQDPYTIWIFRYDLGTANSNMENDNHLQDNHLFGVCQLVTVQYSSTKFCLCLHAFSATTCERILWPVGKLPSNSQKCYQWLHMTVGHELRSGGPQTFGYMYS